MKTIMTIMGLAFSVMLGTGALAARPPHWTDVDCDSLKDAITSVDAAQEAQCNDYRSIGDLLSTALLDPAKGAELVGAINFFYSGNPAGPFTSVKQVLSAVGACGLIPHLIGEINDFFGYCPVE